MPEPNWWCWWHFASAIGRHGLNVIPRYMRYALLADSCLSYIGLDVRTENWFFRASVRSGQCQSCDAQRWALHIERIWLRLTRIRKIILSRYTYYNNTHQSTIKHRFGCAVCVCVSVACCYLPWFRLPMRTKDLHITPNTLYSTSSNQMFLLLLLWFFFHFISMFSMRRSNSISPSAHLRELNRVAQPYYMD